MRYLFTLLGLVAGLTVFSQEVSTTFILPDVAANNNSEVCLPITVINFSAGIEFGFALRTEKPEDGGALTFTRVQNLNPMIPNFDMGDFDLTTYVNDGLITVRWRNYGANQTCVDAPSTVTLPDNAILFEVCYNVVGAIATNHPVTFFDKPDDDPFDGVDDSVPVIFNKRAQCTQGNDAFPGIDNGSVTIGVSPVVLNVVPQPGLYQPGDTYCVDVVAESGFTALKGFQFGLQFDNTILRSVSATANTMLPQHTNASYNLFGGNSFYGVWSPFGDISATLAPGTTIVTACFEIIGECSDRTDIQVGPSPSNGFRPVEANGTGPGLTSVPVIPGGTRLIVDDCNPAGFDVVVDCPDGPINFNDTDVCVQIKAGTDFMNMRAMDYLISWDPAVLEYTRIQNRNPALFINENSDYDITQTGNGRLGFDWDALTNQQPSLPAGAVVFEICFNAIGFGGTSAISVSDLLNDIRSTTTTFNGVNPTNCAITIERPQGVAIDFPDEIGFSSTQDGCFDLEVSSFSNVNQFTLYISLNGALFDFRSFSAAVPGVTAVELAPGLLQLNYNGPVLNLADGASLGSLCYRADPAADPADCAELGLASFIFSQVFTTESEGNSVPVESLDGEACVLFPNGFGLIVSDAEGFISDEVCVPVSVTRFTDVTSASMNFTFDPAMVTFDRVNFSGPWTGLTAANVNTANAAIGSINITWSTTAPAGLNIANTDTVQVFELCFTTLAEDGCIDIEPEDGADPTTTTASGPGSIVYRAGELCLEDRLVLLNIQAIPASCAGADDGMIIFETAARPNNEDIFIRTDNPVRFGNTGSVGGLLPGTQSYTIYNASGSVSLTGTIEIGVDPANAAVAVAGDDTELSCGQNSSAVINGRNNVGTTFQLFILQPDGNPRSVRTGNVSNDGNVVASVTEPGTYILEVTSMAGCKAQDTVIVNSANQPTAEAGEATLILDCTNEFLTLSGDGSSEGANVGYLWERINGQGDVLAEVGTTRDVNVNMGGRYRLTVTFRDVQCSNTDEVVVRDERVIPNSILPTEAPLNCDDSPLILTIGPAENNVEYAWSRLNEGMVLGTNNTFTPTETGTYVVELRNTLTNCARVDTVVVIPSIGAPGILPLEGLTMNCSPDTLRLSPTYENVSGTTTYLWSTEDGRVVITELDEPSPRVVLPGTYQVVVSNGECRDSLSIVVGDPVTPTVNAGADAEILCQQTFRLEGAGSTTTGSSLSYQWFTAGEAIPMGAAQAVVVDQPGTYVLRVTDDVTGCVGTDTVVLTPPMGFPVYELADTIGGLGCANDMITIGVTVANPADYTYRWADPMGNEISTNRTAQANSPGLYSVTITNPATNCQAIDQVFVDDDANTPPFVTFRQNSIDITCESGPALIDASGSTDGSFFEYVWSSSNGGEEPATQGNDTLIVRSAGTYRLTIRNLATECESFREVVVTDSRDFPNVEAVEGLQLDCDTRETVIGVNILDQPNSYNIQWVGPPAADTLPLNVDRITVTVGGTYTAVVINPISSCVTPITIRVEDLVDSIATLSIMQPDSFDCNNTTITIDATDSELGNTSPDNIQWLSLDGNNITPPTGSLIVSVDGPGDYILAITDGNGCEVRDTVTVAAALGTPFAQAGPPVEVDCGEMPQLDGSMSTPAPGANVTYFWSSADGGSIISGEATARPFVSGPGTYQLVVTNLNNGCADTSSTTVMLNAQIAADLPANFSTCELTFTVDANLPAGTTGVWSSFNDDGASFTAEANQATVTELANGITLVWTLSAPDCPEYSSDTVRITPESAPTANNDVLEVGGTETVGRVNLLTNDQRTGAVTVRLLTEPSFGEILSNLNGDITFEAPQGLSATTMIDYELCSVACPTRCDTATLTIRSSADGANPTVFNAFTPNGDGMNDFFVFDILTLRPDEFPDNEIIIFNRWGDILYEASPYANNWDGRNQNGQDVPEGTYYYILRLNIGEGEIIRGDVTVIR